MGCYQVSKWGICLQAGESGREGMTTTTKHMLSEWFDQGILERATHMIVVVDEFDHEDYPVFVGADQDAQVLVETTYSGQNMQQMMEVYNLSKPKEEQLNRRRCYEY